MIRAAGSTVGWAGQGSRQSSWRLRFLVVFFGLVLFHGLLELGGAASKRLLSPGDLVTARTAAGLIDASGLEIRRAGAMISHPEGFGLRITYKCADWFLLLFLLVGFAALPGRAFDRLRAGVVAAAALVALNQLRLVSLFWAGVHHRYAFDWIHTYLWQPVMLGSVFLAWSAWVGFGSGGSGRCRD